MPPPPLLTPPNSTCRSPAPLTAQGWQEGPPGGGDGVPVGPSITQCPPPNRSLHSVNQSPPTTHHSHTNTAQCTPSTTWYPPQYLPVCPSAPPVYPVPRRAHQWCGGVPGGSPPQRHLQVTECGLQVIHRGFPPLRLPRPLRAPQLIDVVLGGLGGGGSKVRGCAGNPPPPQGGLRGGGDVGRD